MSRRYKSAPLPKTAFKPDEATAIRSALNMLYERTVHHLVASKYTLPHLPDVYRSLIHDDVWTLLATAKRIMLSPTAKNYYWNFEDRVPFAGSFYMDIQSQHLLPNRDEISGTGALIPDVLCQFATEAFECRRQWVEVLELFDKLNNETTRSTAAYHWPCVVALMKMGNRADDSLTNVVRPGVLAAEMTVQLRDTNAFVMQHMMLPEIDSDAPREYQGDKATGVAARLCFNDEIETLGSVFWPI